MTRNQDDPSTDSELLQFTIDVWHPDCWTLEATDATGVGLLGYGMTDLSNSSGQVGYYTVFGESHAAIDEFTDLIQTSERISNLIEHMPGPAVAPATRNIVVSTGPTGGMRRAFHDRGYLHLGPSSHEDCRERRRLLTWGTRDAVEQDLEDLEVAYDADISLERIAPAGSAGMGRPQRDVEALSVRQREAFALARNRGYYEYPREAKTATLAAELGVSKATFLEHLRKAERKLLMDVRLY